MLQIGFNFLDSDTPRSNDPFTFTYKSPRVDHKETLSLTFNVGDVSVIWNGSVFTILFYMHTAHCNEGFFGKHIILYLLSYLFSTKTMDKYAIDASYLCYN